MSRWTRVCRAEDQAIRSASAFVASGVSWTFVSCGVLYPFVFGDSHPGRVWGAIAIVLAVGGMFQYFVWKIAAQGVYVGEPGIRFHTFFGSQAVPWHRVGRVLVVDNSEYRNRVLVIDTPYGDRIPTPLCQFTIRVASPPGPRPYVMVSRAELSRIAQALDVLAASRSGGVVA